VNLTTRKKLAAILTRHMPVTFHRDWLITSYDDFVRYNGRIKAREAGRERAEGKEYIVQDGDVILFLHHS